MRTRWFECITTAFAVVVASCSFPTDKPSPSCESDTEMCPRSSKAATSVTCDCRCTVGIDDETGDVYDGRVAVCLPPELNGELASAEVRTGLSVLDARVFDQRVFQYCSQDVARFVSTAVKAPLGLRSCALPIHCECTTKGALHDSYACHSTCEDVACSSRNCPAVLWRHTEIDTAACRCSRATACGNTAPDAERPGVCRDWLTPTHLPAAEDATSL